MPSELETLIEEDGKEKPKDSSEQPAEKKEAPPEKTDEQLKKEDQLTNLNKAIADANEELRQARQQAKKVKAGEAEEEDDAVKIDDTDPSAKAWNKRIQDTVTPISSEMEKEKEEVRSFALRDFLADKPYLAANPEKVKQLMQKYEKTHTSSERHKEGVIEDLQEAFAAIYHKELLEAARGRRVNEAKADSIFSDIAVDHGATSYPNQPEKAIPLSKEDEAVLAKWGMTADEWRALKKAA